MGGFLGIGGSSAKTDRGIELGGFGKLSNIFNVGLNAAQSGIGAGQQALGNVTNYASNILSGNRPAVSAAVAPETAAARSASDAAARQLATSGTARGGGVAGTNQQRQNETRAQVNQAIFKARPEAAGLLTKAGAAQGQIGVDESAIAERAAADTTHMAQSARAQDFKINQSIVGDWINVVADAFAAFA